MGAPQLAELCAESLCKLALDLKGHPDLLGGLVALGFASFRRLAVRELEAGGGPPPETVAEAG